MKIKNEDSCCGHLLTTEEKIIRINTAKKFSQEHQLKKCPFCGRNPHGGHSRHVYCRCGASMMGDDAYKNWNKRK